MASQSNGLNASSSSRPSRVKEMYHYTDSGLDDIYLVNGYNVVSTPYGEAVSIDDVEGLHKAIGRELINLAKPLTGAELRFLRHELDLSQGKLGKLVGKSEQAVRRWEARKNGHIDPIADRLVRCIYSEWINEASSVRKLIERLSDLDSRECSKLKLEERNGRWHALPEAA